MKKLLHITNQPTPYRLPQYKEFSNKFLKVRIHFSILFVSGRGRKRIWEFNEEDFNNLDCLNSTFGKPLTYKDVVNNIKKLNPDYITLAWAMDLLALRILVYSKLKKIPCFLYTGATKNALSIVNQPKKFLSFVFRKFFFKLSNGFIAYGTRTKDYLLSNGVKSKLISIAINTVDTNFFRDEVLKLKNSGTLVGNKSSFKNKDGESFKLHILFIGELIKLKQIHYTIQAIAKLNRHDIALHIVGSGPEEIYLKSLSRDCNLSDSVFFHGYKQKNEIPYYLSISDAAVFTSNKEERFGLVLVEYACAALPTIASTYAGGTCDVVLDGVSGFEIPPENINQFSLSIATLADNLSLRKSMSESAFKHSINNLSLSKSADGYLDLFKKLNYIDL
ncbi:MAG: glycosyltransferase [Chlorobiota bacterium]|nr:MAG: glycosyltransferase [Chlorobiota bacterium]